MILLLDENMPPRVADALHALGPIEAYHVTKYLPKGTPDAEIFAFMRDKPTWVLVTQDSRIRRRKQELAALRQANVGAFILTGQVDRNVEGLLAFLASVLDGMRRQVAANERPFVIGISDKRRFDRLV